MKKATFFFLAFLYFSCQNNTKTKNIDESNSDTKCFELLEKTSSLQSELDLTNSEITNLQTGSGNLCTRGANCTQHVKIYFKRDSLSRLIKSVDTEFQKEMKNSSKEFRLKYYSDYYKKLKTEVDWAKANVMHLESGTKGYNKCSRGTNCPTHEGIYEMRDRKQKILDSISKIINKLKY